MTANPQVEITPVNGGVNAIVRGKSWQLQPIAGSGGGGGKGGGSAPKEEDNNLKSKAYARVLYLVCEGEVEGFPNNILRDTYLDETPIQNPDGSVNYQNVTIDARAGVQGQSYLPGFADVKAEYTVSTKVTFISPLTRTLNDPNANALLVRLMVPSLQKVDDKGNVKGAAVTALISLATDGGPYVQVIRDTISGKTTSPYERTYRINLTSGSSWQIRVAREDADSETNKLQNDLYWQAYTSVIETKLSYPNSCVLGFGISAEQFKSIPKLSLRLRGLKIQVPINYDPVARTYSGNWNGTFKIAYSNNPAWILYDILTETRYGAGEFINASQIDKWSLYAIAQYCDGLVPDGRGGVEPRFVCNCYIQTADEAYTLLNTLASVFRGMLYWANGTVFAVQDSPTPPSRLYTEANVVQEVDEEGNVTKPPFVYQGSSRKARHTVVLVGYSDPDDFYRVKVEKIEDRAGIQRYGYREDRVQAFGCTSPSQARRVGEWLLYTEQNETETITFSVGSEGMLVRPGEVVRVADPSRAGVRWAGRITSIDGGRTNFAFDAPITWEAGKTYTASFQIDTGKIHDHGQVFPTGGNPTTTWSAFTALPSQVFVGGIWMLIEASLQPQLFRILSITENDDGTYELNGVAHNASKFAAIELDKPLEVLPITKLPDPTKRPSAPTNLTIVETLYSTIGSGGVKTMANITWTEPPEFGIKHYELEYRAEDDPTFDALAITNNPSYQLLDPQLGNYVFRVRSVNMFGTSSFWSTEVVQEMRGLTAPPADLTGLYGIPMGAQASLKWRQSTDLDVLIGGTIEVRHTSQQTGVNWANGVVVATLPGNSTSTMLPLVQGTYMVKAVDSAGNKSINPASVYISVSASFFLNQLLLITQDPDFTGICDNVTVESGTLRLGTTGDFDWQYDSNGDPVLFDSLAGLFDDASNDSQVLSEGTYTFPQQAIPGVPGTAYYSTGVKSLLSRVACEIESSSFLQAALFDSNAGFFDESVGSFDGEQSDLVGFETFIDCLDFPTQTPYGTFQQFFAGDFFGVLFRFQIRLFSDSANQNIAISKLRVSIDVPDRTETGVDTTSNSTTISVVYAEPFADTPELDVFILDFQAGDTLSIDQSFQGSQRFYIDVLNGGSRVSRAFRWQAKGWGYGF